MTNKPYDRKLTGARCQCPTCFEYFNSESVFTRHRVGDWQNRGANRRCLSVEEMRARGWLLNGAEFWIEKSFADALERLDVERCDGRTAQSNSGVAGQGSEALQRLPSKD